MGSHNGESSTEALNYKPNQFWKEQDFQSSARLHMQHWIWLYTLGYTLDPKIDLPKDKPVRVADMACCNGAWVLDVHREYPNATIDGFDLTPAHFPAAGWMPRNINFHSWDAFSEVPEQYIGVFDLVHVRALYSAIIDNKVEPVLDNLLKMLKPGGYIQWDEGDAAAMRADVPPNDPKLPSEATTALIEFFHKSQSANAHLSSDWLYSLPTTMKSRGCEVLTQQWTPAKKQLQRAWCDNYLTVWQGVMAKLPEEEFPIPPIQGLQEKMTRGLFFKVLQKAAAECAQGVFINCELCTFVCRKAA